MEANHATHAPRGVYTNEFREQAARWVLEEGMAVPQASQRLSLSPKTLANWIGAARSVERAGRIAKPADAMGLDRRVDVSLSRSGNR